MKTLLLLSAASFVAGTCFSSPTTNADSSSFTNFGSVFDRAQYNAITWGQATNNIQFGLVLPYLKSATSRDRLQVNTYIIYVGPVGRGGLLLPPRDHRLDITLIATNGTLVPMTAAGAALCKPVPWNLHSEGQRLTLVAGTVHWFEYPFDVLKSFKIRRPGSYTLIVKPRLFAVPPVHNPAPVEVLATRIAVDINQSDLDQ